MKCKNCDKPLLETSEYCDNCGAKVIRKRLTLKNLFAHFSEQFLNYDNKFLQTFKALFRRPEDVIAGYISGLRKKYVNVVSYFAVAVTYAGFFTYINQKYFPDAYAALFESFGQDPNQTQFSQDFFQLFIEYQTFVFFLMIPILSFMSRLVFLRNKKYNYAEHLVINLYAYSQMSIVITTISFFSQINPKLFGLTSMIGMPLQILFFAYVLKRMFGLNLLQIILKTLLFLVVLFVFYIFFIIITMIYMFAFTDVFQQMVEQKKLEEATSYIISSAINWTS